MEGTVCLNFQFCMNMKQKNATCKGETSEVCLNPKYPRELGQVLGGVRHSRN